MTNIQFDNQQIKKLLKLIDQDNWEHISLNLAVPKSSGIVKLNFKDCFDQQISNAMKKIIKIGLQRALIK